MGWLSTGEVLTTMYELRIEINLSVFEKQSNLADDFSETSWIKKLAYLTDVFSAINEV
jgi:hypothetical protein